MTTVADYLLQRLRDWSAEHVFGCAGYGINGLLAACEKAIG
jgi:pyruvate dehydrogenase (quinone)